MNDFEIAVLIFLFLIWGQRSKLVHDLAMWLTATRRRLWRKLQGKDW